MSDIQQILNSSRKATTKNAALSIPVSLETEKQTYAEYNIFQRINQLDQFYEDKRNCNNFRFYGYVNEVANLKFNTVTSPNIKPDFSHFDFMVKENWSTYLMAPLMSSADAFTNRGDRQISVSFDGVAKNIDFTRGLPALVIKDKKDNNKVKKGLLMYLGHNCNVKDLISITDTFNPENNGTYRVTNVIGNKIYIQPIAVSVIGDTILRDTPDTEDTLDPVKISVDEIEIGISVNKYNALLLTENVNWLAVITPHIFVKKLVNKIPSDYYMKKLYSLGSIKSINNCGFANNSYNQKTYSFTEEEKFNFDELKTNLMAPITDTYVTFVRGVAKNLSMDSVLATFSNFVTSTFDGGEIQVVNTRRGINYGAGSHFLYQGLVEYNTETLTEVMINPIEHTFLCNVNDDEPTNHFRFGFQPFFHVPIRKFSNNINEQDVYFNIPEYAVFSEKYQNYRWRNLIEIGYLEAGENGIDFPFMNDAFYVFSNILLNIKNYSSSKIPSVLTGGYLISSYNDGLPQFDSENTTGNAVLDDALLGKNKNDKPFEEFNGGIC